MSARTESVAKWMYEGVWGVLTRWLRVPAEPPTMPSGSADVLQSFQPAEGFLNYLKFWFWIVLALTDIGFLVAWIGIGVASPWVAVLIAPLMLAIIVLPDIVAYIAIHLRYDTTWYVMTDRSIRIRRGIWSIRETTITFENVQNVSVNQGPLQRHFGIANVTIETAGASAVHKGTSVGNQGIIEGISDAERIRDQILSRLKLSKLAGLGDEDHAAPASPRPSTKGAGWSPAHLVLLREIRDEAARLRISSV